MSLTRTDKMAAAFAAAFLGLLAGESVLFGLGRPDPDSESTRERAGENSFIDASAYAQYAAWSADPLETRIAAVRTPAMLPSHTEREAPDRENP